MTTNTQPKVQSPLHSYLTQLSKNIQSDQATMARALRGTCEQMNSETVWFGPAATSWTNELTGQSGALNSNIGKAVAAVEEMLRQTPATCTQGQAIIEAHMLAGMM